MTASPLACAFLAFALCRPHLYCSTCINFCCTLCGAHTGTHTCTYVRCASRRQSYPLTYSYGDVVFSVASTNCPTHNKSTHCQTYESISRRTHNKGTYGPSPIYTLLRYPLPVVTHTGCRHSAISLDRGLSSTPAVPPAPSFLSELQWRPSPAGRCVEGTSTRSHVNHRLGLTPRKSCQLRQTPRKYLLERSQHGWRDCIAAVRRVRKSHVPEKE